MKSKPKSRIYSQNPNSSVQDTQHTKGQVNRFKRKTSNFDNEFMYDRQSTAKIYKPSKIIDNFDVRPQQILLRKVSHQDNSQISRAKVLPKRISQHKIKSLGVNFAKNDLGKYMADDIALGRNNQLIEVKFNLKQMKKKQKDKKKLVFFTKGNNHTILKEIFLNDFNFVQTTLRQNAHVCWLQSINQKQSGFRSSKSLYEDHLPDIGGKNKIQSHHTIYNYLQSQSELTNKQKMYKNMKRYFPQSIGSYIPVSFIIDFKQQSAIVEESLMEFIKYYIKKESKKPKSRAMCIKNYYMQINITNKQINKLQEKNHSIIDISSHSVDDICDEKLDSSENQDKIWILKPTSLNRGRGIHLFSSLKQLARLLSESSFQISVKMYNDNISAKSYIIQQYIQRPLLIEGYKFDMRVWVFVNVLKINGKRVLKTYLFKHGYSRLASIKYVGEEKQKQGSEVAGEQKQQTPISPKKDKKSYIHNKFIHLTNNAVQKDAKGYGNYCQGNQLSIQETVEYFKNNRQNCPLEFDSILEQMKKIVSQSVNSVKQKFLSRNTAKTFQLLGYDFLIDQKYNLWLIQINNNPCLQQSSQLLSKLLREMLSGLVVLSQLEEPKSPIGSEGWIEII